MRVSSRSTSNTEQQEDDARSLRVLVLAITSKDGTLVSDVLRQVGTEVCVCRSIDDLIEQLKEGAGAVLVTEEAVAAAGLPELAELVAQQPPWSDLPVLLLTRSGADSPIAARAVESLGNLTLLERPVRIAALVSAIKTALRARQRQYQIRSHLLRQKNIEQALRELDQRKDEFLATLSHELRNPLAPLSNCLQLLRMKDLDPALLRITDVMGRQVNHLERLVDDLLEVSRITRGKIELKPEVVALADIVHAALETSRPLADAASHTIHVDIPEEPLIVYADPVRLTQVVTNLLNNAIKYSERGSNIYVTVRKDDGSARVFVRDDGIGISAEMLPHVFEMFTQVDRSLRRAQGGLGIGLTLVKSLVEMHGGKVDARSAGVGKGSEFTVTLPLLESDRFAVVDTKHSGVWRLDGLRMMVVDDNADAADTVGMVLRELGAEVAVAHDGASALELADDYRPAVILLDIGMPGLDGYAVARSIRSNPRLMDVILIAVTGWGQMQDRQRSHDAGFDYHLVKPISLDSLREILDPMYVAGMRVPRISRQHNMTRQQSGELLDAAQQKPGSQQNLPDQNTPSRT
jgi:signal transduction histidine kinase/response regulator of citrate/malate metabolism